MGLLFLDESSVDVRGKQELSLLHRMGCKVCPLNKQPGRMEPTGSVNPLIYALGEAPGQNEVAEGEQFVGDSGQLLRPLVPRKLRDKVRWNNCVRSRPPQNRTPVYAEIEACRPSVEQDIAKTRPQAIFGFGNVPLAWVSGFNGITYWRGRRMPVQIGNHVCWYYAFLHPAFILRRLRWNGDSEELRMFKLDLKKALKEVEAGLPTPVVHSSDRARDGLEIVTQFNEHGLAQIETFLGGAARQPANGIDYETNCIRPYSEGSLILSASVSIGSKSLAFPFDHPEATWKPEHRRRLTDIWCRYLIHCKAKKVVHNLAFEMEWTGVKFGRELLRKGRWEDTASQAVVLDERKGKQKPGCFSLEFLVQQYFGFNVKKLSNVDRKSLANTPLETVLKYNCIDAKYHLALYEAQAQRLIDEGLESVYELSLRKVPTVVLTQMKGVPVNQGTVKRLEKKYTKRVEEALEQIAKLKIVKEFEHKKGYKFKPTSNPDVIYVFRNMLHRKECEVIDKYSKETKYSADESVLEKIDHPLADLLLRLRKANKNLSTYVTPLLIGSEYTVIYPDKLIHAQFNTIFAETGRLSAESPNLQNFPKREDEAKETREPIEAKEGDVILAVDYGQIEARVIAMFTKDKHFVKALWERYDVHGEWAERIAYSYPARVGGKKMLKDKKAMKDFRTDIKNQWSFPLFFGAQLSSAAGYLSIPENVLKPHYQAFWKQFSGVKDWQDELLKFYQEYGYVECLTGRRRRGPLSTNQAINSPVQGSAAEIVLDAMCRLSETGDPELQPEINIHDDLTYLRVPAKRAEEIAEKVVGIMLDVPFEWAKIVPITAELSMGKNWANLEEIGTFSSDTWGVNDTKRCI